MQKTVFTAAMAIVCAGLLSACATSSVDLDAPRSGERSAAASSLFAYSEYRCNAEPAQKLLGSQFSKSTEAEAIRLSGSRKARTIRPGQVITMEYDPERITLRLDKSGKVVAAGCG